MPKKYTSDESKLNVKKLLISVFYLEEKQIQAVQD